MRAPMVIRQSEQTNRRPPLAPPKPPGKIIAFFMKIRSAFKED